MKGIQFVIDGQGKKKAVLIDLEEWGESWEDIYDVLVARSRQDEPTPCASANHATPLSPLIPSPSPPGVPGEKGAITCRAGY